MKKNRVESISLYKFELHQTPDELKLYFALIFCLTAICCTVQAQTYNLDHNVVSNTGGVYDDGVNQLSFTIGETVIQTIGTQSRYLTQGFQQSLFIISTVEERLPFNYQLCAYPNPAGDYVNLETDKEAPMNISLLDLNGKEILQTQTRDKRTRLDFVGLPNAAYILNVSDESGALIKAFQIQKVQ